MRFEKAYNSEYAPFYSVVAAWCNQPGIFKKSTFRQVGYRRGISVDKYTQYKDDPWGYIKSGGKKGSSWRAIEEIERKFPNIAEKYFDKTAFVKYEGGEENAKSE